MKTKICIKFALANDYCSILNNAEKKIGERQAQLNEVQWHGLVGLCWVFNGGNGPGCDQNSYIREKDDIYGKGW